MTLATSTTTPTAEEQAHIDLVKKLGCLCCWMMGYPHDIEAGALVEAHHLLSGGIRRGHLFTVGLCLWHHRGRTYVFGWDHGKHRAKLGPSLAEGSDPFHEAFGTDDQLLDFQHRLIDAFRGSSGSQEARVACA